MHATTHRPRGILNGRPRRRRHCVRRRPSHREVIVELFLGLGGNGQAVPTAQWRKPLARGAPARRRHKPARAAKVVEPKEEEEAMIMIDDANSKTKKGSGTFDGKFTMVEKTEAVEDL